VDDLGRALQLDRQLAAEPGLRRRCRAELEARLRAAVQRHAADLEIAGVEVELAGAGLVVDRERGAAGQTAGLEVDVEVECKMGESDLVGTGEGVDVKRHVGSCGGLLGGRLVGTGRGQRRGEDAQGPQVSASEHSGPRVAGGLADAGHYSAMAAWPRPLAFPPRSSPALWSRPDPASWLL
jgi:hypothetical protein